MAPKKVMTQAVFAFARLTLFCCFAAWLWAALPARAALQFDAFLGYDDLLPERGWFPISCELDNDGAAFNAEIQISSGDFGQGLVRHFPLDLPTGTRKRVFIPVFSSGGSWNVRLVDDSGHVRGETTLDRGRVVGNGLPLVAALARSTAGLPTFPDMPEFGNGWRYGTARLQTALFPDNPLTLEGIDLLYLSSEKAPSLTLGQVNALMAWLQNGGHLIIGVENLTDINGTPWLRSLLPCDLNGTTTLSHHSALQEWTRQTVSMADPGEIGFTRRHFASGGGNRDVGPGDNADDDQQFGGQPLLVATGSVHDADTLVAQDGTPLVIQAGNGRGHVTVLMFSPEREPFISWKNRTWFWGKLAGIPTSLFQQQNANVMPSRLSTDGIFGAMIDTKQVRKLPLGWLLVLLVAYLVVIGPLDQYWLKKINRQMLTWITFPCYVVIFSALIYYIGFRLRAGELEWNEVNVVDVLPDSDQAVLRGQTYISIYSPNNSHYPLAGRDKFAALRGEFMGNFGGNQESTRADIVDVGNSYEASVFVPVWTSQLFVSDWVEPSANPLGMAVARQSSGWSVDVTNYTDHILSRARVILGGKAYELGDLPAGQGKTVALNSGQGKWIGEMTREYDGVFRSAVQARHSSFGNNSENITDLAGASMAASFASFFSDDGSHGWNTFSGPSTLDLSRYANSQNGILLAWDAGHGATEPINHFQPRRLHRNTLLRLVVPIKS